MNLCPPDEDRYMPDEGSYMVSQAFYEGSYMNHHALSTTYSLFFHTKLYPNDFLMQKIAEREK